MIESSRIDWISRHGDTSNVSGLELRQMAEELWARRHVEEIGEVYDKRGVSPKPTFAEMFPRLAGVPDKTDELTDVLRRVARILPRYHMKGETTGDDEALDAVLESVMEAIGEESVR